MFQYEARVKRIIDGDTMILTVDLGFKIWTEINVRLARIDTAEVVNFGLAGVEDRARMYVESFCPPGSTVVVTISRAEKYGRWLGEILFSPGVEERMAILQNPRVLNDELVREGFANYYSGGRK